MDIDLRKSPVTDLLKLYAEIIQELVRRRVCRSTNNPVADIAELLVIKALGLSRAPKSTKGYDAFDASGKRYEIKGRRITASNPSRMLSAIRDCKAHHFDYLAGVLFLEDFAFSKACLVPFKVVLERSTYREHVNGHILELRDDIWNYPGVVNITIRVKTALESLNAIESAPRVT